MIPEKGSMTSARIEPTLSTRIGLQSVNEGSSKPGSPKMKYVATKTKKQQQYLEEHRANTAKKFCKYGSAQVPKPTMSRKIVVNLEVPSPEPSKAKVTPRVVTPTTSWLYPYPQSREALELKKPKSGIFINESDEIPDTTDYDSFDLVFSRKSRPNDLGRKRKRKIRPASGGTLEDIIEDEEVKTTKKKTKKKKRKIFRENGEIEERGEDEEMGGGEEDDTIEDYLTKQFRRKVSQISQATSYQSKDVASLLAEKEILEEPAINKYIQKFRRDSEIKQFAAKKRKFKRGTLESHSFTDIYQHTLKDFFFGSKEGSMHQGDPSFPGEVRNNQGICMSVTAYCFSILKHPNRWTSRNVDEILEYGNNLYLESIERLHVHTEGKEFKTNMLQKYCTIRGKKIRIVVDDPEVTGYIRSDNKTVYNLTKALKIFFARQSSGILKTQELSIAIWKDKYYYMFDAKPRTRDLYCSSTGTAVMANFYDIPALVTVLLDRSNFGNWPFIIYPIKAYKILNRDDPEIDSNLDLENSSNYNILNGNKAVVSASFDLGDKCFDFTRNKQSLPMSVVCLVYSRITPPSAWHRSTLDKIMIIGNQLYTECMECDSIATLRLDNLPAIFTIGPYIVEIYIYANVYADLINKNCCCQLKCCLEEFFEKSTNAVLQIGKCHVAVWRQRNMYYCFDPYSRNNEALQCRDGSACVSMHSNLDSLLQTITANFDSDAIFYMHALKVCKIHRDPVQTSRFPKHLNMDQFPVDDFKRYKMKKSKKAAVEKPVTVDYSALAMRRLLAGESPDASVFEIGSAVESLGMEQIPSMVHKHPSMSILRSQPKVVDVIADLDSPSLADTHIFPPLPQQPKMAEEIEFMDLDSFELTMEEIELQDVEPECDYNIPRGEEEYEGIYEDEYEDNDKGADMEDYYGEDDWFYAMNRYAQVGQLSLEREPSKISEQINTDITYFPIKREILYPTYLRGKQRMKYRLQRYKLADDDNWDDYLPPEPDVSKSEELLKSTNFADLPDGTEIIKGSKNVADVGKDVEFVAPFVCIMAAVVSKKYSILSWSTEIVDYILKCGGELYTASKFRYDQVSKLEIPRISLGNMNFTVLVEYIFDTYTRQNILELAIEKILFIRSDVGVLVTPTYACALFYKNHLYYMYDCFGNNDVGLSEGPNNTGSACFSRFKDIRSLSARIMYNKKKRESDEEVVYSRFVLSSVKVKRLHESRDEAKKKDKKPSKLKRSPTSTVPEEVEGDTTDMEAKADETDVEEEEDGKEDEAEREEKKQPKNKVGYVYKNHRYVIEGTKTLQGRKVVSVELKKDHFVCICACLMLLTCPVKKWDTNKVDQVLDYGRHVYSHADDYNISEKRTIKNVLIHRNFFDVIVNMIKIENWRNNKNLSTGIDTLLLKKLSYFLVQFGNACYVVHKSQDDTFHLFDPYGAWKGSNAGWLKCRNLQSLKWRLKRLMTAAGESYTFYNFEVTSIKKAPKDVLISQRLQEYDMDRIGKKEHIGKPFYEDVEWLKTDPIPWTRRVGKAADGKYRGKVDNQWNSWDVEYPKDLYSLMGNIHQFSSRFSAKTRGKQTLANLVTGLGMTEIYDLAEWNASVIDSILVNGDNYFQECTQDIIEKDYEISIDDLKEECSIFPFSFKVTFTPIVEGTMFLIRVTQFNLYKALRYFFEKRKKRLGIVCCTKSARKRQVAFGKLQDSEYFMFDCECLGAPMFLDGCGVAYILRTTTLNRLLHVLTLTLRGGDFYIYDVDVSNLEPIN